MLAVKQILVTGQQLLTSLSSTHLFFIIDVTRGDFKHSVKMPGAREELNGSVRERIIEKIFGVKL